MRKSVRICGFLANAMLMTWAGAGCGSDDPPARQDILDQPAEELHGSSVKGMLYEFRAKVRKHGVKGAREKLPEVVENFQGFEQAPVGAHLETYKQINDKLKALEATLAGSPNDADVKKAADEIGTLADKLPGKADENPKVE